MVGWLVYWLAGGCSVQTKSRSKKMQSEVKITFLSLLFFSAIPYEFWFPSKLSLTLGLGFSDSRKTPKKVQTY